MQNFNFSLPTLVLFGKARYQEIGRILKARQIKNVLITFGVSFACTSGLLDQIITLIEAVGIKVVLFGGIQPNPSLDEVKAGLKVIKEHKVDYLLALGGGSVIDATKLMALSAYDKSDPLDILNYQHVPIARMGFGVILTVAASGSETSNSLVVTDALTQRKIGVNLELNRPDFAILAPDLLLSTNKIVTAAGIFDIFMHTFERYLSRNKADNTYIDALCLTTLKRIMSSGEKLINDSNNYDLREEMMLLGMISHNGLLGLGKQVEMPIHKLEHAVSGVYPVIPHGVGLAMLIISYLEVTGLKSLLNQDLSLAMIKSFIINLGLNVTLADYGIRLDADELVKKVLKNPLDVYKLKHNDVVLNYNDVRKIFENIRE
ncbi:MAG: iron-containing alcohol dehydrogenase [Erysipelotrichaceae bacterium]|jgi:alcohol dehydrogenase YqhD (iron-dependent ADH family)|nr:iron-containing alcohol dehydrogenase [Erysipelotrichaceae bacterium]